MERVSVVLDEVHLSCPICLDLFEEPKSLPNCAHNLCKACVQRLDTGKGFVVCPECRVESKIPQSGDFPTNYLLKSLVECIPGRKERTLLKESLAKQKEKVDSQRKETVENFDVLSQLIDVGIKSQVSKLKEQISKTTAEVIDLLRTQEKQLCERIDQSLLVKYEICNRHLSEMEKAFSYRHESVIEKLKNAEEVLSSCDNQTIAQSKDELSRDLENISLGFEEYQLDELMREIFGFRDLKFEKAVLPGSLVGAIVDQSRQEVSQREQHSTSSTKIFLQNLTKNVDGKSLCGLFSPFGKIHCCETAVNNNGESLGCGMVHFEQEDSVTSSIRKMDGVLIDDMKLSVGRCISSKEKQSKLSRNPNTDYTYVYVFYPGEELTEECLKRLFGSCYDKIMSTEVMTSADGKPKGLGLVGFESEEAASQAVEILNGKLINGKTCIVRQVIKKVKTAPPRTSISTVYVSNMSAAIDEELLREQFSKYGAVHGVNVIRNTNGRSRGCGFLYFTSDKDAVYAAAKMNGKRLASRNLVVLYVGKTKGRYLSIKNLEASINEDYLRKEFSAFGDVIEVKVTRNEDKTLRGFVSFTTSEEAAIAAAEMNGIILMSKPLYVYIKQSKEERHAQLEVEFSGCK